MLKFIFSSIVAYFPSAPADSSQDEIITSFITQHYLGSTRGSQDIPKEIILPIDLKEQELLQDALSEKVQHKVALSSHVRQDRKKWLEMANQSAQQSLSSHLLNKTNIKE